MAVSKETPVLECRNLSISYYTRAGEIPAVVDFNLKLMPGEAHGIVGESGCGKSTVALAIMNSITHEIDHRLNNLRDGSESFDTSGLAGIMPNSDGLTMAMQTSNVV